MAAVHMPGPPSQPTHLAAAPSALVTVAGFFSVAAQTLAFRAFFEQFEGTELGVAAFFLSWLFWVSVGALIGRVGGERASWPGVAAGAVAQAAALTLQMEGIGRARIWAGIGAQEVFPLLRLLPWALALNAPVSLATGWIFTRACGAARCAGEGAVARVYMLESFGGAAGGIATTVALALGAADETVVASAAALLVATAAAAAPRRPLRTAAPLAAMALLTALALRLDRAWAAQRDRAVWTRLMPGGDYGGRIATAQGIYRYGRYKGTTVVLFGNSVLETVEPDDAALATVALHLAAAPHARRILVAGGGDWTLATAFLRLAGVDKVVWAPSDPEYPLVIAALVPRDRLPDPARFEVVQRDLRAWLAEPGVPFDLIVLEHPDPVTLSLHRYFTREFLRLVQRRLAEGGVASLRFSGGANYLGPELVRMGASIIATAESVFRHSLLRPGDESRLLLTDRLSGFAPPSRMARSFAAIPDSERIAPPEAVLHAFPPRRAERQMELYETYRQRWGDDELVWSDRRPAALNVALALALKQAGHPAAAAWMTTAARPAAWAVGVAGALAAMVRLARRRKARDGLPGCASSADVSLMIGAIGACGMATGITLMCAWQTWHGGLFIHVGLLSSLFMLGLWAGAALAERYLSRLGIETAAAEAVRQAGRLIAAVAFLHLVALGAFSLTGREHGRPVLAGAMLAGGLLGGAYIPAALRRLGPQPAASLGARLEFFDNVGGMAGGVALALFVLPGLGIFGAAGVLAAWVLCAFPAIRPSPLAAGGRDGVDVWGPRIGALTAWALCVAAVFTVLHRAESAKEAGDPLAAAARELLPASAERIELGGRTGRSVPVFVAPDRAAPERYCFAASDFAPLALGYAGPIDVAISLDRAGVVQGVRVLRSRETPRYFARLEGWFGALAGWRAVRSGERPPVDAVSGATVSSRAILETVQAASIAFSAAAGLGSAADGHERRVRIPLETWVLGASALLALLLRRRTLPVLGRRLAMAAVVAGLGIALNVQMSVVHIGAWCSYPWAVPSFGLAFILPFAVPLFVALFGNLYCGWLCPFGALQELTLALRPSRWRWEPPPKAWRWGRHLKYAVLVAAVVAFLADPELRADELDPLAVVFGGSATPAMGALIFGLLASSWAIPRFWCRMLCPVGAWLSVISAARPLARWWPRVLPRRCDLGVRSPHDLDCLLCDRCRLREAEPRCETPSRARAALAAALILAALAALVTLCVHRAAVWRASEVEEPRRQGGVAIDAGALRRIRERQRAGSLSEREAMYYRVEEPEPSAPEGGRRRRRRGGR